jgi:hypothetical protein
VSSRAQIAAILPLLMLMTSCSDRSTISREQLHSIVRSSISFAVEAEILLDHVGQGRSTRNFAAGHFHRMADEVEQSVKHLNKSKPSPGMEQSFSKSQKEVKTLASELTAISSQTGDLNTIPAAKRCIDKIRGALEQMNTSL